MSIDRRTFLGTSIKIPAVMALGGWAPDVLVRAARQAPPKRPDRILVVIQLSGGNDGLNTVIPYRHDVYRSSRPTLAIPANEVLSITDEIGLHPRLRGFADLIERQQLGIIQAVGYENPNRSHFESMDIWHTAQQEKTSRQAGWLGRALDLQAGKSNGTLPALHIGEEKQPLALTALQTVVPSVKSLEQFRLRLNREGKVKAIQGLVTARRDSDDGLLNFVQASTTVAIQSSERVRSAVERVAANHAYPESALGRKLETAAKILKSEIGVRIVYVTLDGFDTHAEQATTHANLLGQWGDAVQAFQQDLSANGLGNDVLTVCFSEFGRRVQENASHGTDHGTAAPMFIAGEKVVAGLIGQSPDLNDLMQGDLRYQIDFRSVYATLLDDWLGIPAKAVLGGAWDPISFLKT